MKNLLFLSIFCFLTISTQAQRGFELGAWLGITNYFGDLNTDFDWSNVGPAGGVGLRYNFNERVCLKFGANFGKISADDAGSANTFERARNLSFQSILVDGIAQLEFNFLPYFHGSKDQGWTPYLFGGLGVSYFNPKTEIDGELVELRPLGTEGQFKGDEYFTVSGGWVYGFGLKIDLTYEWSLNLEISGRRVFSDYLDDVSTTYPEMDDLQDLRGDLAVRLSDRSPELQQEDPDFFTENNIEFPVGGSGRQRGNSSRRDNYVMISVGFMYYFGDLRCPYEK